MPVAGAGGITSETVKDYVEAGAYDIIVGGGITKTDDIRKAAADKGGHIVVRDINDDIRGVFMMTGFLNLFEIQ